METLGRTGLPTVHISVVAEPSHIYFRLEHFTWNLPS